MRFAFVSPVAAPLLFTVIAECLGAFSILAGVMLWRDTAFGFWSSRFLQAVQIVRIYTGPLLFIVAIGPQLLVNLFFGPHGSISTTSSAPIPVTRFFEFSAVLDVLGGGEWAEAAPTGLGINLFAALALVVLLLNKPEMPPASEEPLPPR